MKALMEVTASRFGRIDILVNNAGVAADSGMLPERVPDEAFASTVQVNHLGLWYCCRYAAHYMLSDGKGGDSLVSRL